MRSNRAFVPCVAAALALAPVLPALADDGSWSRTWDLAEGPLYSATGDPDIALDRELLVLEDALAGSVVAVFQLRNTSDRPVTVDAGFPVALYLDLQQAWEKDGVLSNTPGGTPVWTPPFGKYGGTIDPRLLGAAGLKVRRGSTGPDEWDLGELYIRASEFPKKRVELKVPKRPPFDFAVTQDGKPVAVTSMVVERDPGARPPIVFHFRHQLAFAPGATSLVRVTYKAPTLSGSETLRTPRDTHTWRYILHTGATWKGPLGRLVLAVPLGVRCADEKKRWTTLGSWGGYAILSRTAFEPTAEDEIACRWQRHGDGPDEWDAVWFGGYEKPETRPWEQVRASPPEVRAVRASSEVKFTTDVYLEDGVVAQGAPNAAAAAFDGLSETAWSEASKADAGEYLELELTRPAAGLRVLAGFLGARHEVSGAAAGAKKRDLLRNLYAWNSRPKVLELVSVDGARTWTLPLTDRQGSWNVFPILVPAGKYRLVIRQTYRGKRWQDTSIGEVAFTFGDTAWLEPLRRDPFFAPFFADGAPYVHPWVPAMPADEE